MATLFVSNSGSNTSPYDTEAKAATTLGTAIAAAAAGDTIKVSSTHSESTAGAISYTLPTSIGLKIVCVTFNGSGTGAINTGANITNSTNNTAINFVSGFAYFYGITFTANNGASTNAININSTGNTDTLLEFESCTFRLPGSASASRLNIGNATAARNQLVKLVNCTYSNVAGGNKIMNFRNTTCIIQNFSYVTDSGTPTTMFSGTTTANVTIEASDFSNFGTTNLWSVNGTVGPLIVRMIGCRLPSTPTVLSDSWPGPSSGYVELVDCANGDVNYNYVRENYSGRVEMVNGIYQDADNDQDGISLKMVSSSNCSINNPLEAPPFFHYNTFALAAMTTTVEVVNDGTTFKDNELWQITSAKITSGNPMATWNRADKIANVLATAADQDSSSVSWTGTGGFSNAIKQKLVSGSFTPAEIGMISTIVKLAKASSTVYVSPKIVPSDRQFASYSGAIVNDVRAQDKFTDPGVANVRSGDAYKFDSLTNNKTGTAVIPAAGDVRNGTNVDATTGTLKVPTASQVLNGVDVDNTTGNVVLPATSNVLDGVTYGPSSSLEGTHTEATQPATSDVRDGVVYGGGEGTLVVPDASDVRDGVTFDNGSEGTLDVFAEANLPAAADVRDGVSFGDGDTGLLDLPAQTDVANGVQYDNGTKTGSLVAEADYPDESDVRELVTYGDGEFTGTLVIPGAPSTVRGALNLILKFVGAESLTDEEYDALPDDLKNAQVGDLLPVLDVYTALFTLLDSREAVTDVKDRLKYYFFAKGADLQVPQVESQTSNILLGGSLEKAPADDGKSNIFVGGKL